MSYSYVHPNDKPPIIMHAYLIPQMKIDMLQFLYALNAFPPPSQHPSPHQTNPTRSHPPNTQSDPYYHQ